MITNIDLAVSTKDLEFILDSSTDLILLKDTENNILFANSAMCDMLGKNKMEVIDRPLSESFCEADAKKFYKDDLKIVESKKPIYKLVESIIGAKEKCHVVLTEKLPIIGANGSVEKILVIRKSLEKENCEVKKLAFELKDIKARFDEFGYILRHDLLEPVRMISSFSDLIHQRLKTHKINDDKLSQYLDFVVDSCARMKEIVLRTKKSIKK